MVDEKNVGAEGPERTPGTYEADSASPNSESRSVEWECIAAGRKTITIRYKGMTYQLRETRNGKLILTK